MARLSYVSCVLCAYIFIVLRINFSFSHSDYYFYQTGFPNHRSENYISLELKEHGDHRIFRRDTSSINTNKNISSNATEETTVPSKMKPSKLQKPIPYSNTTKLKDTKYLGVNGTGQRKYFTPTTMRVTNLPNLPVTTSNVSKNATDGDDDEISISKFSVGDTNNFNTTLAKHNITTSKTDTHMYYNSTFKTDETTGHFYWVNMENRSDVKINELLSTSHRRAATIKLSFEFPFYGHLIKNVTIATGGFLYTGEYVHSWLAATQYIAPLMANFDTSLSNDSFIKYVDNGTAFTVEWEKVALQDKPNEGEFTFQVTLHSNGDIVFVYQNVPTFIEKIQDDHHPVKVGLSDAYIMDRTFILVRRKTIYEYHRVNFPKEDIKNWTVIYLTALPTCLESKNCITCLTMELKEFECNWCPSLKRCSSGLDRHRQNWLAKGCPQKQLKNESMCSHIPADEIFDKDDSSYEHDEGMFSRQEVNRSGLYRDPNPEKMGVSGIVAILFLVCMVSGLAVWILYAYRNPHTTSGQMLIKYRPSQWHWRRGEARYTAATIHM